MEIIFRRLWGALNSIRIYLLSIEQEEPLPDLNHFFFLTFYQGLLFRTPDDALHHLERQLIEGICRTSFVLASFEKPFLNDPANRRMFFEFGWLCHFRKKPFPKEIFQILFARRILWIIHFHQEFPVSSTP